MAAFRKSFAGEVISHYGRFRSRPLGEAVEIVAISLMLATVIRLAAFQAYYIPSRSMVETLEPLDHILSDKITYRFRSPRRGEIVIFSFAEGETPEPLVAQPLAAQPLAAQSPLDETQGNGGIKEPASRTFVKRVVAVSGDEIDISPAGVRVNGGIPELYREHSPDLGRAAFSLKLSGRELRFVGHEPLIDGQHLKEILPDNVPYDAIEDKTSGNVFRSGNSIAVRRLRVPQGMLFVMGDNARESVDSRYFGFLPDESVRGRAVFTYWPFARARFL